MFLVFGFFFDVSNVVLSVFFYVEGSILSFYGIDFIMYEF